MRSFFLGNDEYKFYGDDTCGVITANDDRVLMVTDGSWESVREDYKALSPDVANFVVMLFSVMV